VRNIAVGGRGRPFFGCAGHDPKSQENPVVGAKYCGAQIMLDLLCSATYVTSMLVIRTGKWIQAGKGKFRKERI
jgi:hypothetical protein